MVADLLWYDQARSQDLKKGVGCFERVRKLQTTLTQIFIVLESESHGLSKNWDGIFRKTRKFKRFFSPKPGDLEKKRSSPKLRRIFWPKIENSNTFSGRVTTSTSQLRHPISFGGAVFIFSPKTGLESTKNVRFCILKANGGARVPPAPPGYATGTGYDLDRRNKRPEVRNPLSFKQFCTQT